ncbi:MAG: SurA N-terminal domain-containing protein, partial [Solirubrobacterales bacterium]
MPVAPRGYAARLVSRKQGRSRKQSSRRRTSTRDRSAAARQSPGPAAVRRLGLLLFGAVFAILFVAVAIAVGIGHRSLGSGDAAIVEGAPGDAGTITEADLQHAFDQAVAQSGIKPPPKPGDEQYEELRKTALTTLLQDSWLEGEANDLGISVAEKEIAEELKTLKKQSFKSEAEF